MVASLRPSRLAVLGLLASGGVAGCRTAQPTLAPAVQSTPSAATADDHAVHMPSSAATLDTGRVADVRFMQNMILHHAQALAMTALLPARTLRNDMRLLAQRIEVSQKDEIAMMRRWLERHGEHAPSADAAHEHHDMAQHHGLMPGMLTDAEMAQLANATGTAFDRLFLQFMIRHHEGALTMVKRLFASRGAAQDPEIYRFASDVEADQRAEIKRMQTLLQNLP